MAGDIQQIFSVLFVRDQHILFDANTVDLHAMRYAYAISSTGKCLFMKCVPVIESWKIQAFISTIPCHIYGMYR
ncbi:MAG: hypothetical protein ACXWJK_10890, partial [Burkholderiaceae bacterium]